MAQRLALEFLDADTERGRATDPFIIAADPASGIVLVRTPANPQWPPW